MKKCGGTMTPRVVKRFNNKPYLALMEYPLLMQRVRFTWPVFPPKLTSFRKLRAESLF